MPPVLPDPPDLNLTAREHEVWLAVYMATLGHRHAHHTAGHYANEAAKEAVGHYREAFAPALAAMERGAANG